MTERKKSNLGELRELVDARNHVQLHTQTKYTEVNLEAAIVSVQPSDINRTACTWMHRTTVHPLQAYMTLCML